MDIYTNALMRSMGKVFELPHYKSPEYQKLRNEIHNIMNLFYLEKIDRPEVFEMMSQLLSKLKTLPPVKGRPEERISTIVNMLNTRNFSPNSILDIGAGTGDITLALKNHYKLSPERVFAIDQKLPDVKDITALKYVNNKIPLPDNSVDLVVMLMVLHHIPPNERSNILNEVKRVLSPDGIFIIREHDDDKTREFYVFLDMIHIFWYITYKETDDPLYLMSRDETQKLLNNSGLESAYYNSYPEPNPQRIYHEMLIKNDSLGSYRFADDTARSTLQEYVNKFKSLPHTRESFETFVPSSLQNNIIGKHGEIIERDIIGAWPVINKEIALSIISLAIKHSNRIGNIYYITSDMITRAIDELI